MEDSFKKIKNWFGDRGFEIEKKYFLQIEIDDQYIYWIPNNKNCPEYLGSEKDGNVIWCSIRSMHFEIDDEKSLHETNFKFGN